MRNREKSPPLYPFGRQQARQDLALGAAVCAGREYVLSAYMRTDRPGFQVIVNVGDWGLSQLLRLTSEWQRYVVKKQCTQDCWTPFVQFTCLQGEGTFWVDAVQLEEGTEATEYREWRE